METVYTLLIFSVLVLLIVAPQFVKYRKHEKESREKYAKVVKSGLIAPVTLHPHINLEWCIGCASCVDVCPMHVLGIVNGKVALIAGLKCIGIALCEEVCPVDAIKMDFGVPKVGEELPWTDDNYQTNIPGLYIVGELGGMGLIKVALDQSMKAVAHAVAAKRTCAPEGYEILVVGAGPAGFGAACKSQALGVKYVVLEQDVFGGTIRHYPKQKLVMTSPVELPLYGPFKKTELFKEEVLEVYDEIHAKFKLNVLEKRKVDSVLKTEKGFEVKCGSETIIAANVLLALGRRGSPRKLNVPGEAELGKVMYRLIDAGTYQNKHILVVGGGDSAVEAAMGLATQPGNVVTLSYRRETFLRIKEGNETRIAEFVKTQRVKTIFNSDVTLIEPETITIVEKGKPPEKLKNDFVWVFAGGELPNELLRKLGVKFRTMDPAPTDAKKTEEKPADAKPAVVKAIAA